MTTLQQLAAAAAHLRTARHARDTLIAQAITEGATVTELARAAGVSKQMASKWRQRARGERGR